METYMLFCTHFKNSWGPNHDWPFSTWLRLVPFKEAKLAAALKPEEWNIQFLNISVFFFVFNPRSRIISKTKQLVIFIVTLHIQKHLDWV